ncbi:ribosomal-processing cysteine protease Prp, partial [Ruminococcus sp.]
MIEAIFTVTDKVIRGFEISGHSDYSEHGSDIICAAVSSAAYMAANTVT